jgi:hypothetical protein
MAAFSLPAMGAFGQGALQSFDWFGDLAGSCWVYIRADGIGEHTMCFSAQFGTFIRGTTALAELRDGKREVSLESDAVFRWDESSRRIVFSIWFSDGTYNEHEAEFVGEELHFPLFTRPDPVFRSVWRRSDADTLEVRGESLREGAWTTERTAVYHRVVAEN